MSDQKVYLGDGVYVDRDGYGLILTTEDGYRATNTIYLEPEVADALINYINRIRNITKADSTVESNPPPTT